MLLICHDAYGDLAVYDPVSRRLVEFRRDSGDPREKLPVGGHYSWLSGTLAVLYRYRGSLFLRVGDEVRNLDDPAVQVRWARSGESSTLELRDGGGVVAAVGYVRLYREFVDDPTPFVEPEHFDFGLFVTNVLADQARQARIYGRASVP